jgi:hypothetical protein
MNKRAVYFGLIYGILVICAKLFILKGGYALTKFGFYYSHITLTLPVILFYIAAVKITRDKDYNGIISGKECVRICLTIFAVSAILISLYNYFEFEYAGKKLAIEYYHSTQFLDFLKSQPKFKPEQYDSIIADQVKLSEESGFKATTGKLFSMMLIGLSGAFIVSVLMKRSPVKS